jgi:D-beta-D-heptose 7-phosphate kinase / D-beta-D-heptose 1-phosphate adenosyltransferase
MSDNHALLAAVGGLAGANIMCIGDLMLDRFVYGEVERISPEAPIPVFLIGREESMLGGAGNVVRNLVALGLEACLVAVVGDDGTGRDLVEMVGRETRIEPYLLVERDRRSTTKVRYVAGGQQMLRADRETDRPVEPAIRDRIVDIVSSGLDGIDAMILSDYAKGVLEPELLATVIGHARDAGIPVVIDPKGGDFSRYRGATVLTPNRKELTEATRMMAETDDEVVAAAQRAIGECGAQAILVTRGGDGMSLITADDAVEHFGAEAREVYDVSGAGDTVVATVAAALARGMSLIDAARLANFAGGIVVGKIGTAVVYPEDLERAMRAQSLHANEEKIMSTGAGLDQVRRWRAQGQKIGFTNGCFDLLHPGHVSLVRQARARCDRLVLGLNSDASVGRLKGSGRPLQDENSRAQVLASLSDIDAVIIFDDDTPLALIESLKPDLLVKGADYTEDAVVGAAEVKAYGGEVYLASLVDGQSTTTTIARLTA